ncbi:MAG: cyclase family protein [Ktedonobacteraceae bacterium]|nr:cyclase family protein [Ktedonobacteraceae bacterium]
MPQIIDLSMPIEPHPADPTFEGARLIDHETGGDHIWRALWMPQKAPLWKRLGGLWRYLRASRDANRHSFPGGKFLSNEILTLSVHCGTHLDAPYHFGPLCEGKPARRVHEVPLEWCFGHGVVLDLTHKGPGAAITVADLEDALARISYELQPLDIVLIRTDADRLWPRPEYFSAHAGMTAEATGWLVEHGIKVIGIDTNGFDLPFMQMVRAYLATKDSRVLWPAHMYGRSKEYFHMERLANLHRLPQSHGFHVACFPVAIRDAGAAWTRVVAIVEEKKNGSAA